MRALLLQIPQGQHTPLTCRTARRAPGPSANEQSREMRSVLRDVSNIPTVSREGLASSRTTPAASSRIPVIFTAGCFWARVSARVHPPHLPSGVSQDSQQKPAGAQRRADVCIPWALRKCLLTGKSLWFLSCTVRSLTKKLSFLGFTSIYASMHACSVVSDSSRPHGLQPTGLLCPWNFPGVNTGGGSAISYSRASSQPRDGTSISRVSYIGRQILYHWHHL